MTERAFDPNCVFCRVVVGDAPAEVWADGISSLAIVPLNPVVDGHFLVIPKTHVKDAYADPRVTATAMHDAALWARIRADRDSRFVSVNIITSVGRPATQSVFHLHIHVVPRVENDGLALPWTGQQEVQVDD
jgi:histidine triad (HIT) family protein